MSSPQISIVTPSFNQGQFLDDTIRSVLDQGYPNLEYVVMDGGSSDNSVEVIRSYEDRLTYWTSGNDDGHYDAVVKGFARTSGEIMAWINSDDKYTPWAFSVVAEVFAAFPEIEWLTSAYPLVWDRHGRAVACAHRDGFHRQAFMRGANLPRGRWHGGAFIQQESTFWRRSLWERCGATIDNSTIAGDFELWARFFSQAQLHAVQVPLAGFRIHGDQISLKRMDEYITAAEGILVQNGGRPAGSARRLLTRVLDRTVGGKPINALPSSLGGLLAAARILNKAPVCIWEGNAWHRQENYAFI